MNKIFKVIYNRAKRCYVVASELAKSYSKGRGSRTIRRAVAALGIAVSVFTMPQVARADEIIITNGSVSINNNAHEKDDYYLNGSNITFTLNTNGMVNSISGNSDAAVSGNTVTINGGTVNNVDTDWFEFPAESGNWVSKPKLTGGFSISGAVIGNQVSITNAALGGNYPSVYGGYSRTGNVSKNVITVESENSNLYVYGGYGETGAVGGDTAADGNIVTVKSGEVYYVVGGYSNSQDVKNNKALIEGGTVGNFVAGGLSDGGTVSSNVVNISGSSTTISGTGDHSGVYGGYVEQGSGNATSNSVTISGGTVNSCVYGGYSFSGDTTSNSVNISDGSIDTVYGGYVEQGSGNATSNSATISDGTIGSVHGGTVVCGNGDAYGNSVTINGGKISTYLVGGEVEEGIGDAINNSVKINDVTIVSYIYGGYVSNEGIGNADSNSVTINGGKVVEGLIYGGYSFFKDVTRNFININGGSFDSKTNIYAGYIYEPNNSTISVNSVNLGSNVTGLDNAEVYGYYFENGSGAHSGNELHIGRAVDYDAEGNIQRDSEENKKYKSDSSTIWHGKSSDGTVNNSINKIANFDTIALHSVAWNNDLPAIKAADLENIGTVDITDLKFYENGSEKTTFELGDKMNLLTWENEKEALINLKYKLNGTGDEQTMERPRLSD